jgi:hypothetical protein
MVVELPYPTLLKKKVVGCRSSYKGFYENYFLKKITKSAVKK